MLNSRLYCFLLFVFSVFWSCQKNTEVPEILQSLIITKENKQSAQLWLEKQRSFGKGNELSAFDKLKSNIEWELGEKVLFNGRERLLSFPLNNHNDNTAKFFFVIIQNENGNVRIGNIVKLTTIQNEKDIKHGSLIRDIFNAKTPIQEGTIEVLSVFQKLMFRNEYKNYKLYSFSRVDLINDLKSSSRSITPANIVKRTAYQKCTAYYLFVTYYFSDGTTSEGPPVYLYSVCDNPPNQELPPVGDGGSVETQIDTIRFVKVNDVKDSLTSPCFTSIKNSITDARLKNFITKMYSKNYVGYGHQYNLILRERQSVVSSTSGQQVPAQFTYDPNTHSYIITMNSGFLGTIAAAESWAQIMAHELLHSFFSINSQLVTGSSHHESMLLTYVLDIADLLMEVFPTLHWYDARALAIGGCDSILLGRAGTTRLDWDIFLQSTYGISISAYESISNLFATGTRGEICL